MKSIRKIEIQKPWWGAYSRFGWAKGIWGVGFKKVMIDEAIENNEILEVYFHSNQKTYRISPITVKRYSQLRKTQFLVRHNTLLYVVPQTLLSGVDDELLNEEGRSMANGLL
jgi:hypothetical protein